MSLLPNDSRMQPVIIVPPDTISAEDMKLLRDNGLCAVVSADPSKVKFLDPIPAMAGRTKIEEAAVELSRKILSKEAYRDTSGGYAASYSRGEIVKLFIDVLVSGTPLDPNPSPAERDKLVYDRAHADEVAKIAREEAREEAARRKADKAAAKIAKK